MTTPACLSPSTNYMPHKFLDYLLLCQTSSLRHRYGIQYWRLTTYIPWTIRSSKIGLSPEFLELANAFPEVILRLIRTCF
jgi:hypothetical protein